MRNGFRAVFAVALLGLGGCGNAAGIPEFHHYRQAAASQHVAGQRVFDRLAESERALITRTAPTGAGFDPDRAAGYLGIGMPPRTARLRHGLDLLDGYNRALATLAEGGTGVRLAAGLELVLANLGGAAGSIAGAAGAEPFRALSRTLKQAAPVIAMVVAARDRAEFRRRLIAAHPRVRATLVALRDATPAIWAVLRQSRVTPGNLNSADGLDRQARDALASDRRLLAAWVVLIDQSTIAMDAAVAAARSDEKAPLAAMVEASIRLRALAEAVDAARLN